MRNVIKILLIEDNPADARLVDIKLKESFGNEYTLETCSYLSQSIKLVLKNAYDVIFVDLSLPDSTGLDSLKRILDKSPKCPIIVLTGHDDELIGLEAVELGAQDFLVKGNASSPSLKRSINYSLGRYKLLKELSEKTADLLSEKLKFSQAQELAHIGSWDWDIAANTSSWSDELFRIYGLLPRQYTPTFNAGAKYIHPEDEELVNKITSSAYRNKKPFSVFYRIFRSDGMIRMIYERADVITDTNGHAVKMFGIVHDITEQKRYEALEELAIAATKSYNSVVIADRDGKIEWVNEGFTKLNGYTLEDVKNTHGSLLRKGNLTGLSKETELFATFFREKEPFSYENKNYTKEGKEYWVMTTLTPVLGANGEVEKIIAIDSDISKLKQLEEELINSNNLVEHSLRKGLKAIDELTKAKTQLETSLKIKEQFLANMSHEIRTPMNAIIGFTNLMLNTPLSSDQKQYIDAVKTSGENLLVIINDILDFSKLQSGKVSFEQIDFKLSQVISTVTDLMLPKSVEKNIKLSTLIDESIYDDLIGDPIRLNQVLLNLIGNSIKFTERGEIKLSINLLSENKEIVELKFSIIDTGIGIPENKLTSIFDEFTQADSNTTRKYGGSGLGLTIVKQLVETQGGKVSVESKEKQGSTFSVNLKFKKNLNPKEVKKELDTIKNNSVRVEGLHILLVEDNKMNQVLVKKILASWKWNVEIADNGAVAIEKFKKQDFDIILMDMQMPEMDGYEATQYIRNKFLQPKKDIPIMAMTAHAMASEEEKCRNLGMNGYISKPFDQEILYSRVLALINDCVYKKDRT